MRVPRNQVLPNIRVRQAYVRKIGHMQQRKRKRQGGRGMVPTGVLITLAIDLAKRGANTELGQMIIKDAINFVPTAYTKKSAPASSSDYLLSGKHFN